MKRTVRRDVTLIDGLGGEPREHAVIVIEGGRIAAVASVHDHRPGPDDDLLDVAGTWVTPGLIDAHVHLAGGRADVAEQEMGLVAEPPLLRAMRSVPEAQAILKRGYTAVRDVSWNGLYLKRLFAERQLPGPRVIACGPGLTRTGGHGDAYQYTLDYTATHSAWGLVADGPVEVVKAVRALLREGADAIKIFASGGDNWPHDRNTDVHYSFDELKAAVDEAHRQRGTVVMCHAENAEAIRMAVEAGVDTIEHGEDLDDEQRPGAQSSGRARADNFRSPRCCDLRRGASAGHERAHRQRRGGKTSRPPDRRPEPARVGRCPVRVGQHPAGFVRRHRERSLRPPRMAISAKGRNR